jgi:hypothetical protein
MSTSHGRPLADLSDSAGNRVKVYEEVPGQVTLSFSQSEGMWASISMPLEAGSLVIEAIPSAARARVAEGSAR